MQIIRQIIRILMAIIGVIVLIFVVINPIKEPELMYEVKESENIQINTKEMLLTRAKKEIQDWIARNNLHENRKTSCRIINEYNKDFVICYPGGGYAGVTHGVDGFLFLVNTYDINSTYDIFEVFFWGKDRKLTPDKYYKEYQNKDSIDSFKIFKRL